MPIANRASTGGITSHRCADRIDNVGMVETLRDQANTFRREAPQKRTDAFINGYDIEHKVHGFAIPERLVAVALYEFCASQRYFAGYSEPNAFFADFLF